MVNETIKCDWVFSEDAQQYFSNMEDYLEYCDVTDFDNNADTPYYKSDNVYECVKESMVIREDYLLDTICDYLEETYQMEDYTYADYADKLEGYKEFKNEVNELIKKFNEKQRSICIHETDELIDVDKYIKEYRS